MDRIGAFLKELRRRRVFRVAALYVIGAWVVLQVADLAFPGLGIPESAIRYVWIGAFLGFPIALIFGWRFDIIGGHLIHTPDSEVGEPDLSLRRTDYLILAALAVVVGAITFGLVREITGVEVPELAKTDALEIDPNSIAILPFADKNADEENAAFLAYGIHDDLLTLLTRLEGLKVISKTSVEQYRATDKPLRQIGRELGVAKILEGGVQRAGNRIRINVQLIDAVTDAHLWAHTYEEQLIADNVFEIQSDIAQKVADSLQAKLTPEEKTRASTPPTDNLDAYQALLSGRLVLREGTVESVHRAIEHFQQALELDPGFAEAYLAMAGAYALAVEDRGVADTAAREKIEEYSLKALQLDEGLGRAYARLASIRSAAGKFEEAEVLYRQAMKYEPGNAWILHGLGLTLRLQGRALESVPFYDRAARLDPLSLIINESRGSLLRDLGRFEDAEKQYRNTLLIDPEFVNTHWGLGTLYWSMGQPGRAIEWFENAVRLTPYGDVFRCWLALMYLELGEDEQAQAVINEALNIVEVDNDAMLTNELLRIYRGQETFGLPDGRRFMARYWYGSVMDLPVRALLQGDFKKAIDEYKEVLPALLRSEQEVYGSNYRAAIYVAFALKQLGEHERSSRLLDEIEAFLKNIKRLGIHGYWVSDAQIEAIRGNHAASLSLLRKAVDEGWRNLWRFYLLHDPILEPLRANPELLLLVSVIQQEMADKLSNIHLSQ